MVRPQATRSDLSVTGASTRTGALGVHHQLIFPIDTVAVRPATFEIETSDFKCRFGRIELRLRYINRSLALLDLLLSDSKVRQVLAGAAQTAGSSRHRNPRRAPAQWVHKLE